MGMLIDQSIGCFHRPSLYQFLTKKSDDKELPASIGDGQRFIVETV